MKKAAIIILLAAALLLGGCQKPDPLPEWTGSGHLEPIFQEDPVLQSPPELMLLYDGGSTAAILGTHGWNYDIGDGTWGGICVDALHPLDSFMSLEPIETDSRYLELRFSYPPDSVTIRCWHQSQQGKSDAPGEDVYFVDNILELKPHGYIYEVVATWEEGNRPFYGSACYAFYAVVK
jgi:hypothetical protein